MNGRMIDIEYVSMYEDWEICELSKGFYGFYLCVECGDCEYN